MKNNFTRAFIAVLILSFFTLSCKKNSLDSLYVKNGSVNFSVADATTWFKDHLQLEANSTIGKSCKIKTLLPSGSNAIIGEDDKYYAVEFPVELEKPLGFTVSNTISPADKINGSSRLLILKSKKNGYIRSVLMHIFSSDQKPDLTISYSKISKSFNGNIFYTDLYGNFINGYVYENGKIIKKSKLQPSTFLTTPPRDPIMDQCINNGVDFYKRSCDVYADGSLECGPWEYIGTVPIVNCTDITSGGGPDGGEDGDPNDNIEAYSIICKSSFKFNKFVNTVNGFGGWQVAGTNNIHMRIIDLVSKDYKLLALPTMYFGLPVVRSNGDFYSSDEAAALATEAVEFAEQKVMDRYHSLGGSLNVVSMTLYYRQQINSYMQSYGGTGSLSSASNITVTDFGTANYDWPILGCL